MLVLIRRQVETELELEEKFRELCEEVSNVVKEREDVVQELERLSGNHVAKETARLLRRRQKRDLYKMTGLHIMVNESHLNVREKHTFVSKMNLETLVLPSTKPITLKTLKSHPPISQQSTRNRGKAIVTSSAPTYDPEPLTVTEDDEMSKEKEIDKLMALISLSFKKIYKPTNNNLRTSSNSSRANQDNSPRINRVNWCYNCKEYGHVSRECQKPKRVKDAAYHKEKMLLCKQEEAGFILNAEHLDGRMIQYESRRSGNWKHIIVTWHRSRGDTNITIDSLDICYDRAQDD
ncbi:reverse transcriptase domain-containing protein [Tanacetum coccineum]